MPRNTGVSGRSTMRFNFFKPSERTMALCFSGVQMGLRTSLILIFPVSAILPNFLLRQTAQLGDLRLVSQLLEGVNRRLDDIVGIVRADRLRQHVRNPDGLNDRANGPARDYAGAFGRGFQQHLAAAEGPEHRMPDGGLEHVDLAQIFLRRLDALLDRGRNFLGLAGAETDDLGARIADDDQSRKAQVFAALDDLGDAIDRDDLLFEIQVIRLEPLLTCRCHQNSSPASRAASARAFTRPW